MRAMIVAAGVSRPPGVQSTSTMPSASAESMDAVIGFQSAPPAAARLPFKNAPDPLVDHVPLEMLTSGACAASAVEFVPTNVSYTATGPVLTVTVAVEDAPLSGVAVIVALP